jgi:hypothetical protein
MLGVAPRTVWSWRTNPDNAAKRAFPVPKKELAATPVWDGDEIVRWRDRYMERRKGKWTLPPGRPPTQKRKGKERDG